MRKFLVIVTFLVLFLLVGGSEAIWCQISGTSFKFLLSDGEESEAEWYLFEGYRIKSSVDVEVPWMLCESGLEVRDDFKVISGDNLFDITNKVIFQQKVGGVYKDRFKVLSDGDVQINNSAGSATVIVDSDTGNLSTVGSATADKVVTDEVDMSDFSGVVKIKNNSTTAFAIKRGANSFLNFDTSSWGTMGEIDINRPIHYEGSYFRFPENTGNALNFQSINQSWYLNFDSIGERVELYKPLALQTAMNVYMIDNSPYAFVLKEGSNTIFEVSTEDNKEAVNFYKNPVIKTIETAASIYFQRTNYDPTNGTNSRGEIRWNPSPNVVDVVPSRPNSKVVTVGMPGSGAMFTDIQTAISSIIDESASNRYTVLVYPGTYTITSSITMTEYIDLMGVDRDSCIIYSTQYFNFKLIIMDSNSSISNLTVNGMCVGYGNISYPLYYNGTTLSNFYAYNCRLIGHADVIYLYANSMSFSNVVFDSCSIESEWAQVLLTASGNHSGNLIFKNCNFIILSTADHDGGMAFSGSTSFRCYFDNCSFINYSSTFGMDYSIGWYGNLYINSCRFISNSSSISAYGIRSLNSSKLYVFNSYLDINETNSYDLWQGASSNIYVANTKYDTSSGTITPLNEGNKKFDATTITGNISHPVAGTWTIDLPDSNDTYADFINSGAGICGLKVNGVAVGGAIWGAITGTLSNQTDLQTALDGKLADTGDTATGNYVLNGNLTLQNATGVYLPDNNPYAMTIQESTNKYLNFDTTDFAEKIDIYKTLNFTTDVGGIIKIKDNYATALRFEQGYNAYLGFDTTDSAEKIDSYKSFNLVSNTDLLYNSVTTVIDNGVVQSAQIQDSYLLNTGDTATGGYVFNTDNVDIDGVNSNIGIGINTNQTTKLIDVLSDSTLDWNKVLFIDHDNNATESSNVIEIDNDANLGTVHNDNVAIYNFYDAFNPTMNITATDDSYTASMASKYSILSLAGITFGNTVLGGMADIDYCGNNVVISGNPVFNNAGEEGSNALTVYGAKNTISFTPTLTNVRSGSTLNTYGSYNAVTVASGGNVNLEANTYGVYGVSAGNLTTTGTTNHFGGYFSATGTADTNSGIYATASGGSTNYAGYFDGIVTSAGAITSPNFVSNVATGTQSYATTSTTLNTNLNADLLDGQHASQIQPTGSIIMWGTTSAPTGWLICDGTAVSRTTYSGLFAVIGTNFGVGDGSTTFNLPNLKSRFPVGYNSADADFDVMGETGGAKTHTHTGVTAGHTHYDGGTVPVFYDEQGTSVWDDVASESSTDTFTSDSSSNVVPYITLNFIIKF